MSEVPKQSLAVLRRIAEFLEFLPQDKVNDLAEGRARLTLIPWGSEDPLVPILAKPGKAARPTKMPSDVDILAVLAELDASSTREEATALLARYLVGDLRAVAASLGIRGVTKTAKVPLIQQIVDFTVGARLSAAAIRAM